MGWVCIVNVYNDNGDGVKHDSDNTHCSEMSIWITRKTLHDEQRFSAIHTKLYVKLFENYVIVSSLNVHSLFESLT